MKKLNLKKNLNRKFSHCGGQQETENHLVGWIAMNTTCHKKEKKEEEEKEKEVVSWRYEQELPFCVKFDWLINCYI